MKLIYMGDIHLRDKAPANRVDDYLAAQWRKLRQLVKFSNEHKAPLLLGGDIFDTPRVSVSTIHQGIVILRECDMWIYCIAGQHDILFHMMEMRHSPLSILEMAGAVDTLMVSGVKENSITGHAIHFVSWEQTPAPPVPGMFNIFLGHVSVFEGEVPFYWKGEGYTPETLRKKYPGYDLYLCGDIHKPLVEGNVVVSGSMMRMGVDQIDYQPRCYLIDTDTMDIQPLYFDIDPDVFSIQDEKIKTNLDLDALVGAMRASAVGRESFKRDCLALAEGRPSVKKIIQEVFDGID